MQIPNAQSKRVEQCIYCPNPGTTDEHVVPIAFGGYHVLIYGSCERCAHITRDRETFLCENNFNALRFHHGYPRASLGKPRSRLPDLKILEGKTPHEAPVRKVPYDKVPGVSIFPIFPRPGILLHCPPTDEAQIIRVEVFDVSGDGAQRQKALEATGFRGALAVAQFNPIDFMRVLAKIAHGYAVFNVGLGGFRACLQPRILGKANDLSYFVGGHNQPILVPQGSTKPYSIAAFQIAVNGQMYLGAQIRLFASVRPLISVYSVIFGQPLV